MRSLTRYSLSLLFALYSAVAAQSGPIELLHTFTVPALADQFRFSQFGQNVRVLGDLNGDGFDDWAIGLPEAYHPVSGLKTGLVYVYFGSSTITSNRQPDLLFAGNENDSHFGEFICGADINGDSYSDLIVKQTLSGASSVTKLVIFYGGENVDTLADDYIEGNPDYYSIANAVSPAGDVNNDGRDDLLLSAYHKVSGKLVYVLWGAEDLSLENSLTLHAPEADGYFGNTLSAAGDINNDGYADFLIGSPSYTQPSCYIYLGGDPPDSVAYNRIIGLQNTLFSSSMSPAGHINNDDFDDFMVAAPYTAAGGEVQIFYGGDSIDAIADLTLDWGTNRFLLGNTILPIADINNDGYDEVLLSVEFGPQFGIRESQVHLYFSPALTNTVPDVIFNPHTAGDGFGISLAAGDIDADSDTDILIGASGITNSQDPDFNTGYISFFLGGGSIDNTEDLQFYSATDKAHYNYGQQVASFDMTNDSLPEVIISAPGEGNATGVVYIYQGSLTPDNFPEMAIYGLEEDDQLGYYLAPAGDLNNDGYQDVIISYAHGAYVLFGGAVLDPEIDLHLLAEINSMPSVSSAGDVNNDGYVDILMSYEYEDNNEDYQISVMIFYGSENPDNIGDIIFNLPGSLPHIEPAGDLNSDGFDDLLIGVWQNNEVTVRLFYGADSMDNPADKTFAEELESSEYYGRDFEVGDINGDGYNDLVVISEYETGGGRFFVYLGDSQGIDSLADFERSLPSGARSLTLKSDLNSDHINDISIGMNGQVGIFWGGLQLADSADLTLRRGGAADDFGNSISSVAGRGLLVGAPRIALDGPDMGQAYVYGDDSLYTVIINDLKNSIFLPDQLDLSQNYPNPYNPKTVISYQIPLQSQVDLSIYNILGQKVATLVSEKQGPGRFKISWNASGFSSGVFFYRLNTDDQSVIKKMILIK